MIFNVFIVTWDLPSLKPCSSISSSVGQRLMVFNSATDLSCSFRRAKRMRILSGNDNVALPYFWPKMQRRNLDGFSAMNSGFVCM